MSGIRTIALAKAVGGSGGGSSVTVEALSVTENGTITAPSGKAYSPVNVNVPNTYSAGDEGKVVSNGALVAQTAHAEVTSNGTIDTTLNNSVVVNVPQGGGGSVAASDVNFYDYDGTIVAAYSAADFASLTALPANPDRTSEGLTAQGWNWTLADAKTYVAAYGRLNIGQTYITTDGKTHVHIRLEQGRTSPMLGVCPNGTVDVDWGDGTTHDTLTGTSTSTVQWTPTHNYAAPGDYVIKLTVSEGGSMGFYGSTTSDQYSGLLRYASGTNTRNRVYQNAIQRVEVGIGVTSIGSNAFHSCSSLASISIPDGVTSIVDNAFQYCSSLASISIPDSVTSIWSSAFNSCTSLVSISIPDSVTSIGSNAFQYCYGLASISIPDRVTGIGSSAFNSCSSLASISIPDSVTSIGSNAFQYCSSLASISIPDSVTSIGSSAFNICSCLANISIPDGVTSIGNNTLSGCGGLAELHFNPSNPPTVSNSNAFKGIPTDCKIYVPTGSLTAYTSASNYPSSSTYTYVEE